jgi:hypothetical protein
LKAAADFQRWEIRGFFVSNDGNFPADLEVPGPPGAVASTDQHTRDGGGHEAGEGAAEQRTQTELSQIAAAFRSERADAADLDADGEEIREAAQGVGGDDVGTVAQRLCKSDGCVVLPSKPTMLYLIHAMR